MAYTPRHHQVATEDGTKYIARSADGTIIHQGEVQKGQNITTGQEVMQHTTDLNTYLNYASEVTNDLPPIPEEGEWVERGLYRYGDKVALCVQAHTRMHYKPEDTPALFVIREVSDGPPPWQQPTGAHDAYSIGDVVTYESEHGNVWESQINGNTTRPDGDVPHNRYWEPIG